MTNSICHRAEPAKKKHTSQSKAQQEQRNDDSASAAQPAKPEVPASALHAASKSGDADKVECPLLSSGYLPAHASSHNLLDHHHWALQMLDALQELAQTKFHQPCR